MKYLFALLTVLLLRVAFATTPCDKCDLEKVRIVNQHLDSLTAQMVHEFLCTFDNSRINNAEYSELSNETLYLVLEKAPDLFFKVLTSGHFDDRIILREIENPLSDGINLQKIYDKIKLSETRTRLKTKYLNALILAAEKGKQKIKK